MTEDDINDMDRKELIHYLEGWGVQCYDWETTDELRDAALANLRTEGA